MFDGDEGLSLDRGENQNTGGVTGLVATFFWNELNTHSSLISPRVFICPINMPSDEGFY